MFDDFDLSDSDTQTALGIAALCEIIYLASAFQSGMGWDAFPMYLKVMLAVIIPPVMFVVAKKVLNK